MRSRGIDTDRFWRKDVSALVEQGWDASHAWLRLLLDNVGPDKPLGELTNADLREFGATLDDDYFEGIPEIFDDLKSQIAKPEFKDIEVEFYIVSGGLRDVLVGSSVVDKYFDGIYASELAGEADDSPLKYVKRCVTFTEKTRYIFEINKGLDHEKARRNPYEVNRDVPPEARRVRLSNMVYLGDGLTDVPCFSLIGRAGGTVFGVFSATEIAKAKRAFLEFLEPGRVTSAYTARYRNSDDLGIMLRTAVTAKATSILVQREAPYEKGN